MTLTVVFHGEGAYQQLDQMVLNINSHLPSQMKQEFEIWQSDDMNRKFPTIDTVNKYVLETSIYPRGRKRILTAKEAAIARHRAKFSGRKSGRTRPILRPELMDLLTERMRALLAVINWIK